MKAINVIILQGKFLPFFDLKSELINEFIFMKIQVSLYYHLKEKAGVGNLEVELAINSSIKELKLLLEEKFPSLKTHLGNVLVLMNGKIVLDEDNIKNNAEITFLTPVGGG